MTVSGKLAWRLFLLLVVVVAVSHRPVDSKLGQPPTGGGGTTAQQKPAESPPPAPLVSGPPSDNESEVTDPMAYYLKKLSASHYTKAERDEFKNVLRKVQSAVATRVVPRKGKPQG
eukprot:GHVS01044471.1.p1 GENE.GHVS01044471.1~~GHVS01044471.1.p1  ORF type:complete len:116 (+),score=14.83 GHVS01044471.1:50-397(+)